MVSTDPDRDGAVSEGDGSGTDNGAGHPDGSAQPSGRGGDAMSCAAGSGDADDARHHRSAFSSPKSSLRPSAVEFVPKAMTATTDTSSEDIKPTLGNESTPAGSELYTDIDPADGNSAWHEESAAAYSDAYGYNNNSYYDYSSYYGYEGYYGYGGWGSGWGQMDVSAGGAYDLATALAGQEISAEQAAGVLGLWFPGYSAAAVKEMLEANENDLASTFNALTALELEDKAAAEAAAKRAQEAAKKQRARAPTFRLDPTAFPTLGGGAATAAASTAAGNGTAACGKTDGSTDAQNLAAQDAGDSASVGSAEVEASPPAAPTTPEKPAGKPAAAAAPAWAASGRSFAQLIKDIKAEGGPDPFKPKPKLSGAGADAAAAAAAAAISGGKAGAAGVPWVATGDAAAREYASAREEARGHARLRNACFQQATLAFLAGNKALAKQLSQQGKTHAEAMREAHGRASEEIFRARNPAAPAAVSASAASASRRAGASGGAKRSGGGGSAGGDASTMFVDLHGLHVTEALSVLQQYVTHQQLLGYAPDSGYVLKICVGTGHHTKGAVGPRLPSAVQSFLQQCGIPFRPLSPGLLEARLC